MIRFQGIMQLGPIIKRDICTQLNCINCNAQLDLIVECNVCHRRQPLGEGLSYFSLISPRFKPSLEIDQTKLKEAYLLTMKRCHPDRAMNGCEKVSSEAWSTWATRAYSCLKDPFSRAQHYYKLVCKGFSEEEDKLDSLLPSNELAEIMENRELVEESDDPEFVSRLMTSNDEAISENMDALGKALGSQDCKTAKLALIRLKYQENMKEACRNKLEVLKP